MKPEFKPYGAVPSATQMEHFRIEKKAFFHFGINTFTNKEWGDGNEAEKDFNPVGCDCRQWIRTIKEAGFRLAIITAKHHDGFCLWPSKYTEHNISKSAYKDGKGDLIREFVDACHEYGIKVGVYISPWDRNAPFWGTEDYSPFFAKQLEELMTEYGEISEVWWDGAGSKDTPYNWGLWAYTVKVHQPNAAIFGSMGATPYVDLRWVGNEGGFAGNPCFATIDKRSLQVENTYNLNHGIADGELFVPAEVDTSIRPGWFYHEDQDARVKTVPQLVRLWFDSVGSNANMLLNFPPDRTGRVRAIDVSNILEATAIIDAARSVNLASGATVTASEECYRGCDPFHILMPHDDAICAAVGNTLTLTLQLRHPTKFNMFEIGEAIEYGHRIRGWKVEALVGDEWKIIFDGTCMGYKWAEYFEEIESSCVRICVYDAKAEPLLRSFALHRIDTSVFEDEQQRRSGVDLAEGESARRILGEYQQEVELGGIYPFNTIVFDGTGIRNYTIQVFNGSNYETVFRGSTPSKNQTVQLPQVYRTSYKLKLVSEDKLKGDPRVSVYEL